MKKTIFSKIFGGSVVIILLLSFLILFTSFRTIRRYYIDTLITRLEHSGHLIVPRTNPLIESGNHNAVRALMPELALNTESRITIVMADGTVIADSEEDPERMENHANRPEIQTAMQTGLGSSIRFSRTVKADMLYVAIRFNAGTQDGVVRMSMFLKDIETLLAQLQIRILELTLAATGLALIAAVFLSRSLSVPIRTVADGARRVADGDFDVQISVANQDEIHELAVSFNNMTGRIKSLFTDLSQQKGELDSIISSIEEALLVIAHDGTIILSNQSAQELTEQNQRLEGRPYWEVLRFPEIAALIQEVTEHGESITREIEALQHIFLASGAYISKHREVVLILHDITQIRALENLKKDFVANVSHELRTPLTAIKGFIETLEEEADESLQHYISIIQRHTNRLINIVRDLLLLSEIENKKAVLQKEEVRIFPLIRNVVDIFGMRIRDKGLVLNLDISPELPSIRADEFRLEQVLINLVENAVKYTEKGEISISARLQDTNAIIISVKDTGAGIPPEDHERVFERFYVVDKSRSRKMGGTGLGLSIVKHVILMHNGTIQLDSRPGEGTTFTVTLPLGDIPIA